MKTPGMAHQLATLDLLKNNPCYYANGSEQGTGKTWAFLADIEVQFIARHITGALILAPKGVHTNWTRREIPRHMSVPTLLCAYRAGATQKQKRQYDKILQHNDPQVLPILAMNIDAVNTKYGYQLAQEFLATHKSYMVVDESHTIKGDRSKRTQRAIALGELAITRRIGSGTMMDKVTDLFSQFEFLLPRGKLLGTTSMFAFKAEYAVLLPQNHSIVQHRKKVARVPAWKELQVISIDPRTGTEMWKNLDRLTARLAPNMCRYLKKDCLDLPEKVYQTYTFEMAPAQRKIYDKARDELRYEHDSGQIDRYTRLTRCNKLQQITSGFILSDGQSQTLIDQSKNVRLELLKQIITGTSGQFIVWAVFRAEIAMIEALLTQMGITHVSYHGGVSEHDRESNIDAFQSARVRAFVGNEQTAGAGLTLTAAKTAIYYSTNWSSILRKQSEDRNHRYGSSGDKTTYIDIAAINSVDEKVAAAHQAKSDVSAAVLDCLGSNE